jgi:hypothetical protein
MSTAVKKKAAPKGSSGNSAKKAAPAQAAAERPFQRNALKKLSSQELDREVRDSAKGWHVLTRKAQTLEKKRLLPVIEEVGRRIKAGHPVGGYRGIEAYINSLGLPPSLVRKWRFRERKKNGKKSAAGLMQNADALTRGGYYRKDITSWFHKALRRGDENAALFCASELDLSGIQGHVWNTLIVAASEDVGLADNSLTVQLLGLFKSNKALGDDEEMARRFLLDTVLLVAGAKKNRLVDEALNAIYNGGWNEDSESLLVEVVKLDKEGRGGEAWKKLRVIASKSDAEVGVQVRALSEHWKCFGGKAYAESDDGASNRLFLIHAALICERAEQTRQTERVYADRVKRKVPDYALDLHSRTGPKDHKRTKDSIEGIRHFLEKGAKLENEDNSIPNPYRPHFEKWMWSKVKKAAGAAAGRA